LNVSTTPPADVITTSVQIHGSGLNVVVVVVGPLVVVEVVVGAAVVVVVVEVLVVVVEVVVVVVVANTSITSFRKHPTAKLTNLIHLAVSGIVTIAVEPTVGKLTELPSVQSIKAIQSVE
jgi:hypothetical protein